MLSRNPLRCLQSPLIRTRPQHLTPNSRCRPVISRSIHTGQLILDLIEPLSQTFHWGFQELHTRTGLPWYLTIPLGASLLRMSWMPFQIWMAQSRKPRETVTNLTTAWRAAYRDTARIKFPGGKEEDARNAEAWVISQLRGRKKQIQKHQKYVGTWVEVVLATSFLPVWILGMDCIRTMAGDTRSLTKVLYQMIRTDHGDVLPTVGALEPGFAAESLYWIPSLVSPDPLWVLPITFGVLSTYSIWTRVKHVIADPVVGLESGSKEDRAKRASTRFFKKFSYMVLGLPSLFTVLIIRGDMATAVVLYLLTTTTTQLVQRSVIARVTGTHKHFSKFNARPARAKR